MSSREEMLVELPEIYRQSPEFEEMTRVKGVIYDRLEVHIDDVLDNFFIDDATWGLAIMEDEYKIPTDITKPLGQRRSVLKAKKRGIGTVSASMIRSVAESFRVGSVDVKAIKDLSRIKVSFSEAFVIESDLIDAKNAIRKILPAHLEGLYALRANVLLEQSVENLSPILVNMDVNTNPWAQAGYGGIGDEILLDGEYLLNGERFLNGFYNKDGPAHSQRVKLVMKVLHGFGFHEVNLLPSLDGEFNLNGEIRLQNEPQNVKLAVLHDVVMRYKQRETIHLKPKQKTLITSSSKTKNGVVSLNGQVQLDGSVSLDQALFNHSGLFRVKKDGKTVEEVAI